MGLIIQEDDNIKDFSACKEKYGDKALWIPHKHKCYRIIEVSGCDVLIARRISELADAYEKLGSVIRKVKCHYPCLLYTSPSPRD